MLPNLDPAAFLQSPFLGRQPGTFRKEGGGGGRGNLRCQELMYLEKVYIKTLAA